MKKILLLSLVLPVTAFAAPAHPVEPSNVAYHIVEGLTTEVGQRLAGTEAEARARTWAVVKLKALGFANVHIETYDMPVWVRGVETAEVIAPYPQRLVLAALGNSGATPETGMTGDVIGFSSLEALIAAPDASVKGKIVYVSHQMKPTQNGSSYGAYGPVRFIGASIAAKKGAAVYLIKSLGTDNRRAPHTGVTRWETGVSPIPAAALTVPDADNLERMLARAQQPVQLHITLTPKMTGIHQSGNVVAEVPGRDADAGTIIIGGHLDSWDLGTGAIDDGAGVAITTAAAENLLDGPRPRRTIRVVWWGSEEEGGFGSTAYFEAHKNEKFALAAESDFGADRVWAFGFKLPETAAPLGKRLISALSAIGVLYDKESLEGGADVEKFIESGVPAMGLKQDGTHYFDLHHTPDDTLDKIDPAMIQQNTDAWTIMLNLAANAPEDLLVRAPKS